MTFVRDGMRKNIREVTDLENICMNNTMYVLIEHYTLLEMSLRKVNRISEVLKQLKVFTTLIL